MKIKTASGNMNINKKTPYGKFIMAYCNVKDTAWTGWWGIKNAWDMAKKMKQKYPSISYSDLGKMIGEMG